MEGNSGDIDLTAGESGFTMEDVFTFIPDLMKKGDKINEKIYSQNIHTQISQSQTIAPDSNMR